MRREHVLLLPEEVFGPPPQEPQPAFATGDVDEACFTGRDLAASATSRSQAIALVLNAPFSALGPQLP